MQKFITHATNPFPFIYKELLSLTKSFTFYVKLKIPPYSFKIKQFNDELLPITIDFSQNWLTFSTLNVTFKRESIYSNQITLSSDTEIPFTVVCLLDDEQISSFDMNSTVVYTFRLVSSEFIRIAANSDQVQILNQIALANPSDTFDQLFGSFVAFKPLDKLLTLEIDVTHTFKQIPTYFSILNDKNELIDVSEFNLLLKNI